jgi:hypothetical protein
MNRKMTKGIAHYIRDRRMCTRNNALRETERFAVMLADRFKQENRYFDTDRFYSECGIPQDTINELAHEFYSRGYFDPKEDWQSLI